MNLALGVLAAANNWKVAVPHDSVTGWGIKGLL
jgi:hypothetical protein